MPTDTKLEKLKTLLDTLNDGLTRQEFESAVKALVDYVKKVDVRTESELAGIKDTVERAILRIESTATETTASTTKDIQNKAEKLIDEITFAKEAFLAEAQAKLDAIKDGEDGEDGEDGIDADETEIVERVLAKIQKQEIPKTDLSPLENKIEALEKRISSVRTAPIIGPSRGVFLYVNGVKKGLVSELDIIGGGVATSVVNGRLTISITSSGGGAGAIGTPTGTVNGVNTTFTFSSEPTYIVVDGISKFEGVHYTYVGTTIEITDGAPPVQFIRAIYNA